MTERLAELHPDATGFTLFRGLPNGGARAYSAAEFDHGRRGAAGWLNRFRAVGAVKNSSTEPSYGVLDVLNAAGDIVQDYDVPTAQGFQYIKRMLKLTVASEDPADYGVKA